MCFCSFYLMGGSLETVSTWKTIGVNGMDTFLLLAETKNHSKQRSGSSLF